MIILFKILVTIYLIVCLIWFLFIGIVALSFILTDTGHPKLEDIIYKIFKI